MKFAIAASAVTVAQATGDSPIGKVVQMLADLEGKIIKEGKDAQKIYEEFSEWCEDRAANLGHEIKTGQAEVADLKAVIAKEEATTGSLNAKLEGLAGELAKDQSDLKAATDIRAHEATNFAAEEKELVETTDMLQRAIGILEREMAKSGGASLLQGKKMENFAQVLNTMVQASAMNSADATKLTALLQNSQKAEDADSDEQEPGAPAAAVYQGQSGNIIDTLKNLLDSAEEQLDEMRKKETANLNNFQLMKQALTDEIKFGNQDMAAAKKGLGESKEAMANAQGDLGVTSKELSADLETKSTLHHDCMTKAEDFEAEVKSRGEELKALAEAKKAIVENTGGATSISYGLNQVSFLQKGRSDPKFEVERMVRELARKQNSASLAQLAQRIESAVNGGARDPFAKIKGLITDMISKLEGEADADATEKAYCDKETKETTAKKVEKTAEIEKLSTRIDRMTSRSAALKEEVTILQDALAKLASSQAQMDKLRAEEKEAFLANKADMQQGISGVKMALKVLSEYYASSDKAHEEASGAGKSIISLLEVVESDFSKELAEIVSTEDQAAAEYDRQTKENQVEKRSKTKDVEYKTKEFKYLDKESAELTTDREGVQAELDAVLEYLSKINDRCIAKAETYAERKRRRTAEIAGLKEALTILEGETALVQRRLLTVRRHA